MCNLQTSYLYYHYLSLRFTAQSQSCPEKNGRYPVPDQCDAYIECVVSVVPTPTSMYWTINFTVTLSLCNNRTVSHGDSSARTGCCSTTRYRSSPTLASIRSTSTVVAVRARNPIHLGSVSCCVTYKMQTKTGMNYIRTSQTVTNHLHPAADSPVSARPVTLRCVASAAGPRKCPPAPRPVPSTAGKVAAPPLQPAH